MLIPFLLDAGWVILHPVWKETWPFIGSSAQCAERAEGVYVWVSGGGRDERMERTQGAMGCSGKGGLQCIRAQACCGHWAAHPGPFLSGPPALCLQLLVYADRCGRHLSITGAWHKFIEGIFYAVLAV